jgi:hypothetical protein
MVKVSFETSFLGAAWLAIDPWECEDRDPSCESLKLLGACKRDPKGMQQMCPVTCDSCPTAFLDSLLSRLVVSGFAYLLYLHWCGRLCSTALPRQEPLVACQRCRSELARRTCLHCDRIFCEQCFDFVHKKPSLVATKEKLKGQRLEIGWALEGRVCRIRKRSNDNYARSLRAPTTSVCPLIIVRTQSLA